MELKQFVELGYKAAEKLASKIDAGNANEFAATSLVNELDRGSREPVTAIMKVQKRCGVNLSSLLMLDDEQRQTAVAAFAGGCLKFAEENPDE